MLIKQTIITLQNIFLPNFISYQHDNIIDSPTCGKIEDTYHSFFSCVKYARARDELLNNVFKHFCFGETLQLLITGAKPAFGPNCMIPYIYIYIWVSYTVRTKSGLSPCVTDKDNEHLFSLVHIHMYIKKSKRFNIQL